MTAAKEIHPIGSSESFDLSFKVFHELMAKKVNEILLVSSPYDAFIMEEEGRLAERIIHEYRGLNLSRPPMLTWVSSAREALEALARNKFDLVITMPRLDDMDAFDLGKKIKKTNPDLPVYLLTHNTSRYLLDTVRADRSAIDRLFVWSGNADLLLALIKSVEDRMNIDHDTQRAMVRVIILVEDSPVYCSSLLPLLYKEIVTQTQGAMERSVNEEHKLFRMRARPKILVAETFEEAVALHQRYRPFLLSIFSDSRFPRNGKMDERAGFELLRMIQRETPDVPLLNLSSEESNRKRAARLSVEFLNKDSPTLHADIGAFFNKNLGFGEFIFRMPDGEEAGRASTLRDMEKLLVQVPPESVLYHAERDHFSTWLMARSEILLAYRLKPVKVTDFPDMPAIVKYLVNIIHERRKGRQRGIVTDFASGCIDPDADFIKIGKGSLGGKARGLAFLSMLLKKNPGLSEEFPGVVVSVPRTLVISTVGFDAFIQENNLKRLSKNDFSDDRIREAFLQARVPQWLERDLEIFLSRVDYPLAVRSSSLLEDALFQPFAGIYATFMIPNNHPNRTVRLGRLLTAIKLVYASTYLEAARHYARNTMQRIEDEKMAVVIQELTGAVHGAYFHPAFSGVAQSYNFYPSGRLKPEEGVVHVAAGLGKTVVEGGAALRFSPKYPNFLPQFSRVEDILKNAQQTFYALRTTDFPDAFGAGEHAAEDATLARLGVEKMKSHPPARRLFSTYMPADNRIRDVLDPSGYPVLTFAGILKHGAFRLPDALCALLELGRKGMGCPVEMEFAVNLPESEGRPAEFHFLQIRPMGLSRQNVDVKISREEMADAFCYSTMALGHGLYKDIRDVLFVRPDVFDPARTVQIAGEIGPINAELVRQKRKYLLIGPGRWGSADRWLGVPVD
ncbi:MAG: phosphoenolpyruvate synthase PpsA, partial [Desulfobacterales bacterium]|nr:phosphoenolpyruvate synthase PpsA [Desulfobacterales bacterium]